MNKTKTYKTTAEMLADITEPENAAIAKNIEQAIARRQIVKHLIGLRAVRGLSQKDIAQAMGCTQSRISKLEQSDDDDIRLGDLHGYLSAVGFDPECQRGGKDVTRAGSVQMLLAEVQATNPEHSSLRRPARL